MERSISYWCIKVYFCGDGMIIIIILFCKGSFGKIVNLDDVKRNSACY